MSDERDANEARASPTDADRRAARIKKPAARDSDA